MRSNRRERAAATSCAPPASATSATSGVHTGR